MSYLSPQKHGHTQIGQVKWAELGCSRSHIGSGWRNSLFASEAGDLSSSGRIAQSLVSVVSVIKHHEPTVVD